MTPDPTDPTPAHEPPEAEATPSPEPAAPADPGTADAAAASSAASTLPAGSLFQDRPLTPVEAKRLDVARIQPKPWQPTDDVLDPTSDTGWEQAADHELIAIRPEDVPVPEFQTAQGAMAPAAPMALAPFNPVGPSTAALSWAKAASAAPAIPAVTPLFPPGAADAAAVAAAAAAPAAQALTPDIVGSGLIGRELADQVPAPVTERRWTRAVRKVRAGAIAGLRPVMLIGLFTLGIALGWTTFLRSQPVPEQAIPAAARADNGTSDKVPPQIASLVAALSEDNQTAVQVVVPAQPYRLLAGELAVDGISSILGARALSTYTVGNDSATEILITGVDPNGNAVTFNLIVHIHNGAISDFR